MSPKEYAQGAMYGKGMYGMYDMCGHYTQWHDMYGQVLATSTRVSTALPLRSPLAAVTVSFGLSSIKTAYTTPSSAQRDHTV